MKKNKIINYSILFISLVLIVNTLVAYVSYRQVCDKKEPTLKLWTLKEDEKTTYNEFLYNIKEEKYKKTRTVSLKLFFLK